MSAGDLDCDMKSDSSPERDAAHLDDVTKEPDITDDNKKRKRKPYRPGGMKGESHSLFFIILLPLTSRVPLDGGPWPKNIH